LPAGSLREHRSSSVVWLFGHPIGHSLSPVMQNAAFRQRGLDVTYVARDVEPAHLSDAVAGLRSPRVLGANVTLPHKEKVVRLLDSIDAEAARVGAVNTIVNREGMLCGYNTDIAGFLASLRGVLGRRGVAGLECLVLGAGGAARAALAALNTEGAARVWVANRTSDRAKALCRDAVSWGDTRCEAVGLESVATIADACSVIVNATSLGLPDSVKDLPIDVDTLHSGQVLLDLAYGAGLTPLVQAAKAKGLRAVDGKEMLVQQAALSYRLWTGSEAPLDVMRGSIGR
jgi:shikimate dehydrogenase